MFSKYPDTIDHCLKLQACMASRSWSSTVFHPTYACSFKSPPDLSPILRFSPNPHAAPGHLHVRPHPVRRSALTRIALDRMVPAICFCVDTWPLNLLCAAGTMSPVHSVLERYPKSSKLVRAYARFLEEVSTGLCMALALQTSFTIKRDSVQCSILQR